MCYYQLWSIWALIPHAVRYLTANRRDPMNTNVSTNPTADANLMFVNGIRGRDVTDNLIAGIRAEFFPDEVLKKTLPSVLVGSLQHGKPAKGSIVVPTLVTDKPLFSKDGKVLRGSVTDQTVDDKTKRKVIVSHKQGNDWIVLVRTGLRVGKEGMLGDFADLSNKGELTTHGSFNANKNSGAFELAKSREEKAAFGKVDAEQLWQAKSKKIAGLNMPKTDYTFWLLPEGAVILVRDINGQMVRVIGGKTQVLIEDATGYEKFFDRLFQDHHTKKAA